MAYMKSSLKRYGRHRSMNGLGALGADCARTAVSADGSSLECIDANDNVISSSPMTSTSSGSGSGGGGSGGSSGGGSASSFAQGLLAAFKPATAPMMPPQSGISTTTLVVAGIGVLALVMIMGGGRRSAE